MGAFPSTAMRMRSNENVLLSVGGYHSQLNCSDLGVMISRHSVNFAKRRHGFGLFNPRTLRSKRTNKTPWRHFKDKAKEEQWFLLGGVGEEEQRVRMNVLLKVMMMMIS